MLPKKSVTNGWTDLQRNMGLSSFRREYKNVYLSLLYHGVTANLKNKQIKMKEGIGISTIWITSKERTNYSK